MQNVTRRSFVAGSLGASLSAKLAAAGSKPRIVGANDRLRVGVIGVGGNGTDHINALQRLARSDNVEITAVCDIYQKRLDAAAEATRATPFSDYRALLDQSEIDYVVVSVPEHWHYRVASDALSAGKHIYLEKPLTYGIDEGRKLVEQVRESSSKVQVGIQGMSDDSYETAQQHVKAGALGKVVMAQIDYSRNEVGDFFVQPHDEDVRPGENLDWEAFLGPARPRPFDPDRFFAWRRYWDYSGGIATDLFVHRLARIVKACDLKAPSRVVATGGKYGFADSAAEIPDTFNVMLEYPDGMTVLLVSSLANRASIRHVIRGHEATLEFTREGFVIEPEREFASGRKPIVHKKTGGEDMRLHHQNLHNAIRRNEPLKCDVELGFYVTLACLMAVESYRKRRYLAWDARREKVVRAS